jgi:hypothetical protein
MVIWNLVLVGLETVLVSVNDRYMICAKCTTQKSFWMQPMVVLGDEAQVEAHFGPLGDSDILDAREVHGLRRTYHRLRNHF